MAAVAAWPDSRCPHALQVYLPTLSQHIRGLQADRPHSDISLSWDTLREVFDRLTKPPGQNTGGGRFPALPLMCLLQSAGSED
jgi:hypothetical protein